MRFQLASHIEQQLCRLNMHVHRAFCFADVTGAPGNRKGAPFRLSNAKQEAMQHLRMDPLLLERVFAKAQSEQIDDCH
jgi:hypothetical protein